MTCECTTARFGGARPSTIDAWQGFLMDIREWLLCFYCPSLSPSLLIGPWDVEYVSVVLFCYILDAMLCYVWKKIQLKIVDNKRSQDPQLLNRVIFKEIQTINTVLWLFSVSWQIAVLPQFNHVNRSSFHIYIKHEITINKHQKVFYFNHGTHHFSSLSPPKLIYCLICG